MKRLFIRTSALATVVALGLGLIAIAKAQFGMEERQVPARRTKSFPTGAAESVRSPALVDGVTQTNPLRPIAREPRPSGPYPVIPASAVSKATGLGNKLAATELPAVARPRSTQPARLESARLEPVRLESAGPTSAATPVNTPTIDPFSRGKPAGGVAVAGGLGPGTTATAAPAETSLPPAEGILPLSRPAAGAPSRPISAAGLGAGPTIAGRRPMPPPSSPLVGNLRSNPTPTSPASLPDGMAVPAALPVAQGSGVPGDKHLEGPQTPQLTIEKTAPEEIQVGKAATFVVRVRNTGTVAAQDVEVRDEVPRGTKLQSTNPRASRGARGELVFELGVIQPDEEASVEVVLMPVEEGEIGSVATVQFHAAASARTVSTRPQLTLRTTIPSRALLGSDVTVSITVSNPGSGVATGVVLEEHIPAGLNHPAGSELEYELGDLAPNQSRQVDLVMTAAEPGKTVNLLIARADASLEVADRKEIEVTAPQLTVAVDGPKRRYLEREAVYTLAVSNPGTAPARDVELLAHLPSGLKFISADNKGQYDEATGTVSWRLEELPVRAPDSEPASVQLTTLPVEPGQQIIRFSSNDDSGLSAETEHPVLVEGIAAIFFEVVDVDDPIEVGGQTTYEIRVVNQGSKAASNVQLVVHLSPKVQFIAAEGPVRYRAEPGRILFEPLPRLAPKADTTYRLRIQGIEPGDVRLRVELMTSEIDTPITKEESTRIYSDE